MKIEDIQSPLHFAQEVQMALGIYRYCYITTGDHIDGDCTSTKSTCSENEIAMFLLVVEEGAILGCNGWDEQFSNPLGQPTGFAEEIGDVVERRFNTRTYVTWLISKKTGKIFWAQPGSDEPPVQRTQKLLANLSQFSED